MSAEDKTIVKSPISAELDQNVERVAHQLETQIIGAIRVPFVDRDGRLKANTRGASQVAVVTTDTPQELDLISKAMTELARKGIHEYEPLGHALFVDCSAPVRQHFPRIKFERLLEKEYMMFYRDRFALDALRIILTAIRDAGVDITKYPTITEKAQTAMRWERFSREVGPEAARRIIPQITKELAMAGDPVHLFPIFALEQPKTAETCVVIDEITEWNSEDTTKDFVGPWGSVFVISSQVLKVVENQDPEVRTILEATRPSTIYPVRVKGHRLPASNFH